MQNQDGVIFSVCLNLFCFTRTTKTEKRKVVMECNGFETPSGKLSKI